MVVRDCCVNGRVCSGVGLAAVLGALVRIVALRVRDGSQQGGQVVWVLTAILILRIDGRRIFS